MEFKDIKTKKCTRCEEEKEEVKFSKNKAARDGLCHWCKECSSVYQQNNKYLMVLIDKDLKERFKRFCAFKKVSMSKFLIEYILTVV